MTDKSEGTAHSSATAASSTTIAEARLACERRKWNSTVSCYARSMPWKLS